MIAILWRYRVKPEHCAAFETAYGPVGDWARLFHRHAHYLGTELLRASATCHPRESGDRAPTENSLDYLTVDRWRSEADFADFMVAHCGDYEALDAATESWTEEEVRLGVWKDAVTR